MTRREESLINRSAMRRAVSNMVWKDLSEIKMTNMQQSRRAPELYLNCFHGIRSSQTRVTSVTDVESTLL